MAGMLEVSYRHLTMDRPPVLLAAGPVLLRPLGMAGIPAIVASTEDDAPAFASRYCAGRCILPPRSEPSALVDALIDAGERLSSQFGRRVPLMYGEDYFLELIYMHRERLQQKFLLLLCDPAVATGLLTKDRFDELARARGIPVPRSLDWDMLSEIDGPVLAKPRSKCNWHHSPLQVRLFGRSKALAFENGSAVMAQPFVASFREQLVFQEYIRGDDRQLWSFHGVSDERGKILASFLGRKLRASPPFTGESSFIEMIENEELAAFGRRLAERLPLKGPFKIDLKTDVESGQHFVLEVNARFNLWHCLGAANGLNLMEIAYDYVVAGKRPPPLSYRTDTRWLCLPLDWRAYRALSRQRQLTLVDWVSSILFTRTVYNVFAWSDPAPLAMTFVRKVRKLFRLMDVWWRQWLSTAS